MPFRSKKTDAWNDTEIPAASIEHDYPTSDHLTASPSPKLSNVSTDDHTKDVPNNTAPCPTGDDIQVDNELPSLDILAKIQDYPVLDVDGKSIPFKSIYTGPNVARRVLVIFVRHFYCGNCQEYLRLLTTSITPEALLSLPVPTFIAIVGCGSPTLIKQYAEQTKCPFPLYTDPTRNLYKELGMTSTFAMGPRPDYDRRGTLGGIVASLWNNVRQIPSGKALSGGDYKQVGGEFLFEPVGEIMTSPVASPVSEGEGKQLGAGIQPGTLDRSEEKRITWCHRMRNTRDHAEIPELREVLGLDGHGNEVVNGGKGARARRWSRAVQERKGTGISQMSGMKGSSGEVLTGCPSNASGDSPRRSGQVDGPAGALALAPGTGVPEPALEEKPVAIPMNS